MFTQTYAHAAYLNGANAGILDASPHRLTSLLLRAARDKVAVAEGAIDRNDVALRADAIGKATDIVIELKSTLDLRGGGEIATRLGELYEISLFHLLQANLHADKSSLSVVSNIISEIESAWLEIKPSEDC